MKAARSQSRSPAEPLLSAHRVLRYHLDNPYWKTFDPYVKPLLEGEMDLRRYNEIDASESVKVEQDPELWKAVQKHQS